MKKGYVENLESMATKNTNFRKVVYTTETMQLVLMALPPTEEIGVETHVDTVQFFRVEEGKGIVLINDTNYILRPGTCIIVPAGAKHNIINTDTQSWLKMYTIYAPPHHKDKITHRTKESAEKSTETYDGVTTE